MDSKTIIDVDTFFEINYCNLLAYCKDKNIKEDNVHEVYIKLKNNVYATGMTAIEYNYYVKKSLFNLMLDEKKSLRYKNTLNFDDTEKQLFELEKALNEINETDKDTQLYREETEYITKMLFKYIEVRGFTEYEIFIFKSYFLVPKMTYKKLNEKIGVDVTRIQRTIRNFKADIKENFLNWLKEYDKK